MLVWLIFQRRPHYYWKWQIVQLDVCNIGSKSKSRNQDPPKNLHLQPTARTTSLNWFLWEQVQTSNRIDSDYCGKAELRWFGLGLSLQYDAWRITTHFDSKLNSTICQFNTNEPRPRKIGFLQYGKSYGQKPCELNVLYPKCQQHPHPELR